jgi:hypothetical protein
MVWIHAYYVLAPIDAACTVQVKLSVQFICTSGCCGSFVPLFDDEKFYFIASFFFVQGTMITGPVMICIGDHSPAEWY